ncbi:hypothetical protein Micbo1qcDRAFT_160415, partial [Microdochium bolleyi]
MMPPSRLTSDEAMLRAGPLIPFCRMSLVCCAFLLARSASRRCLARSISSSAASALANAASFCSMVTCMDFSRRRLRCMSFLRSFSAKTSRSLTSCSAS